LLFLLVDYAGSTEALGLYGHESSFGRVVDWKERFDVPSASHGSITTGSGSWFLGGGQKQGFRRTPQNLENFF
jgi:hypothetical protein